jgi:protein-S-isoprenylcysteine O-methyltransferase Ste14
MLGLKLALAVIIEFAVFAGLLFGPAGTLRWWRAWLLLGVFFGCAAATLGWVLRDRTDLLNERLRLPFQAGQPRADKILMPILLVAFVGWLVFIPLDVFRLRLLGRPGPLVSSLGLVLVFVGWWLEALAMRENPFAIAVVRHQPERHQTVIDSGIYGVVRHPMYAGAIPLFVGMALWLESYAGVVLAAVPSAVLVVRTLIEERLLRRELQGYAAYAGRVRYRLIPLVW